MPVRSPIVAGLFYPADPSSCRQEIERYLAQAAEGLTVPESAQIRGGIVPHAGWAFSGPTAAHVYAALRAEPPETMVFFGAVHSWGVSKPSLYGSGSWATPLGELTIDLELAQAVVSASEGMIVDRPDAHREEHSLEVQMPFVKHLFPQARILPIAMPSMETAHTVGCLVAEAAGRLGRNAIAIGSSDLTHYGPRYGFAPQGVGPRALEWTKANDQRLLDLVLQMRIDQIVPEAQAHHNACGAGAIAAAMAFAAERGATRGLLLEHVTSHEVRPMGPPSDMVGYGAVLLVA
jgi:AmmeMemoRadiSam system protein B